MDSHQSVIEHHKTGQSDIAWFFQNVPASFWVGFAITCLVDYVWNPISRLLYVSLREHRRRLPISLSKIRGQMAWQARTLTCSSRWLQLMYTVFELVPTLVTVENISARRGYAISGKLSHEDAHTCTPEGVGGLLDTKRKLIDIMHMEEPVTSCMPYTIHTIKTLTGGQLHGTGWYIPISLACGIAQYGAMYLGVPIYVTAAVQLIAPVLLCPLYIHWRHVTILVGRVHKPEDVGSNHHVGIWKSFRVTALLTFLFAAASAATRYAVFNPASLTRVTYIKVDSCEMYASTGMKLLYPCLLWLALTWTMIIPAQIVLTRVQASLLPDGQKTIVPFDRTFGIEKARERDYLTAI